MPFLGHANSRSRSGAQCKIKKEKKKMILLKLLKMFYITCILCAFVVNDKCLFLYTESFPCIKENRTIFRAGKCNRKEGKVQQYLKCCYKTV